MNTDPEDGRNFNLHKLKLYTNERGFILGESKLGDRLGVDGADVELDADFTSINWNVPTTVESGLFVHREVETIALTAVVKSVINLKGQRVKAVYGGTDLFKGTVREVGWNRSVDFRPQSLGQNRYTVSLLITAGDEEFANAVTPPRSFTTTQVEGRVGSWLGLTVDASDQNPSADLGEELYFNLRAVASTYRVVTPADDMGTLQETLRNALRTLNMHYVYKPWDGTVKVSSNNRWHSGTSETVSLVFTDVPGDIDEVLDDDAYVHNGWFVSYLNEEIGEDPDLFCGSVQIQTNFGGEETFGPYRANEVNPSDVTVDLGVQGVDGGDKLPRNYVSTLPLQRTSRAFTKSIRVPLQSYRQLENVQVPGMAILKHEGVTERVAVLGVTHSITPSRWDITYQLGPHHLLDRESDYDPSPPTDVSLQVVGSVVTALWHTPRSLPTDVQLYRYVFRDSSVNRDTISWSTDITIVHSSPVSGEVTGDAQTASFTLPVASGTYDYFVAYTSDPNPGSGVANQLYRQSQPTFAGTVVVP